MRVAALPGRVRTSSAAANCLRDPSSFSAGISSTAPCSPCVRTMPRSTAARRTGLLSGRSTALKSVSAVDFSPRASRRPAQSTSASPNAARWFSRTCGYAARRASAAPVSGIFASAEAAASLAGSSGQKRRQSRHSHYNAAISQRVHDLKLRSTVAAGELREQGRVDFGAGNASEGKERVVRELLVAKQRSKRRDLLLTANKRKLPAGELFRFKRSV